MWPAARITPRHHIHLSHLQDVRHGSLHDILDHHRPHRRPLLLLSVVMFPERMVAPLTESQIASMAVMAGMGGVACGTAGAAWLRRHPSFLSSVSPPDTTPRTPRNRVSYTNYAGGPWDLRTDRLSRRRRRPAHSFLPRSAPDLRSHKSVQLHIKAIGALFHRNNVSTNYVWTVWTI